MTPSVRFSQIDPITGHQIVFQEGSQGRPWILSHQNGVSKKVFLPYNPDRKMALFFQRAKEECQNAKAQERPLAKSWTQRAIEKVESITGFAEFKEGLEEGHFKKGMKGALKLFALSFAMTAVFQGLSSLLEPKDTFQFDETKLIKRDSDVLVVTAYTGDSEKRVALSEIAAANHQEYARKRGYSYYQDIFKKHELACHVYDSIDTTVPCEPQWRKVFLLQQALQGKIGGVIPKKVLWIDDDALFTNLRIPLDKVFQKVDSEQFPIWVTEDSKGMGSPLNTGIVGVVNTPESRAFLDRWLQFRDKTTGSGEDTYGTCKNQSCLHEQAVLSKFNTERKSGSIAYPFTVIPQRGTDGIGINTFKRWSHYDSDRQQYLNYKDPPEVQWQEGDFIGHCTGLQFDYRLVCVKELAMRALFYSF